MAKPFRFIAPLRALIPEMANHIAPLRALIPERANHIAPLRALIPERAASKLRQPLKIVISPR